MPSSLPKELYNPKAFFIHAAWLRQGCPHCAIFPTAASRRSLGRVSVPVWLVILSDQLEIVGLVSLYLTNYLIPLGLILWHVARRSHTFISRFYAVLASATRHQRSKLLYVTVRLACVKPAASVQSEPWSNSSIQVQSLNTADIKCHYLKSIMNF